MNDAVNVDHDAQTEEGIEPDAELRCLLNRWPDPEVPAPLDARVLESFRKEMGAVPWWQRVLAFSIPVPLPVAVAVLLLLFVSAALVMHRGPSRAQPSVAEATLSAGNVEVPVVTQTNLAGFEPVKDMNPTVMEAER
jgi:hypothetical protein